MGVEGSTGRKGVAGRRGVAGGVLILLVLVYRATLGRLLVGHCRFVPSCSQYMIDAIEAHGAWRGVWRGIKRLLRCHPWGGRGGYDPA